MKLELPDNNASVLFHMGNALQSIAKDLDLERVDKLASHIHNSVKNQQSAEPEIKSGLRYGTIDPSGKITMADDDELSETVSDVNQKVTVEPTTSMLKGVGSIDAGTDADDVDPIIEANDTIDADGLPWDQRIHSRGKTRLDDNTWRMARKPKDKSDEEWAEYVEGVKVELKALMAIPVATGADLDVLAETPVITDEQRAELKVRVVDATDVNGVEFRQLSGEIHNVEINGTLELPPIVNSATFEAVANGDIGAGQPVRVVTPPVDDAVVTPPVVDAVVAPPVVDTVVAPPIVDAVVAPPIVDAVVTGPTTFPELMKFITVNNKKLTKESVDEALKAQGLASIALLAARTDLIPQVHAALVKLL